MQYCQIIFDLKQFLYWLTANSADDAIEKINKYSMIVDKLFDYNLLDFIYF